MDSWAPPISRVRIIFVMVCWRLLRPPKFEAHWKQPGIAHSALGHHKSATRWLRVANMEIVEIWSRTLTTLVSIAISNLREELDHAGNCSAQSPLWPYWVCGSVHQSEFLLFLFLWPCFCCHCQFLFSFPLYSFVSDASTASWIF